MATGNAIARQVTTGEFDLVLTTSTPSMQAVANANRDGRHPRLHASWPTPSRRRRARPTNPLKHPPHMVGQGSFLPVDDSFELARRRCPSLKPVGVAWNPAESNSEAFTRRRAKPAASWVSRCSKPTSTAAPRYRGRAVAGRARRAGAVGGRRQHDDGDAGLGDRDGPHGAHSGLHDHARRARPRHALRRRPRFSRARAHRRALPARVLRARSGDDAHPRRQDEVPRRLVVNTPALAGLKDAWQLPDVRAGDATVVVDGTGRARARRAAGGARWRGRGAST